MTAVSRRSFMLIIAACIPLLASEVLPAAAGPDSTPGPLVFQACMSGKTTLDQGDGGGNPFASAVIEALARPQIRLAELPFVISELTAKKSRGFQSADVPAKVALGDWQLTPPAPGERRIALVLVVSDYAASGGAQSLPGVKHDAARVARAFEAAGFKTEVAIDLDRAGIKSKLDAFSNETTAYDAAVIYTTGHGVEVDGNVYLLPGAYPIEQRNAALSTQAVRLKDIAAPLHAKRVNFLFYGGCRNNPFAN